MIHHHAAKEKKARILTARMNRAGIASLEELKAPLDAHGEAKMRSLGRTTKEGVLDDVNMSHGQYSLYGWWSSHP